MTIEERDFKLESCGDDSPFWDLSFKKVINKGKENERVDYGSPLYGLPIDSAIRIIVHHEICQKHKDEVINLVTYFKDFQQTWNEIREICHGRKPGVDKN